MASVPIWVRSSLGWWVTAINGMNVYIMRVHAASWRWHGFADGRLIGMFDGIANAKKFAARAALEIRHE